MKKYIGTKTIMAKPMAKSEAEKVLNRSLADAKGGEDGYLVEYPEATSHGRQKRRLRRLTRLLTHTSTVCVLSMPMSRSAF